MPSITLLGVISKQIAMEREELLVLVDGGAIIQQTSFMEYNVVFENLIVGQISLEDFNWLKTQTNVFLITTLPLINLLNFNLN